MLKWINKKRNQKGFTLVELVVVIAILGILAAIAVPKLSKSRENAAIAAHNANVSSLYSAATMYIASDWDGNEVEWTKDGTNKTWEDFLQKWPDIPKGLGSDAKDTDGKDVVSATSYKVIIENDGEIIVTPKEIKPLTPAPTP